jgi:hypothetical protein
MHGKSDERRNQRKNSDLAFITYVDDIAKQHIGEVISIAQKDKLVKMQVCLFVWRGIRIAHRGGRAGRPGNPDPGSGL